VKNKIWAPRSPEAVRRGLFAGRKRMTLFIGAPLRIGRSFATAFSLEAGRLTNGQKARLPVYSIRLHNAALQIQFMAPKLKCDNFNIQIDWRPLRHPMR
jgi:hypothetical protein